MRAVCLRFSAAILLVSLMAGCGQPKPVTTATGAPPPPPPAPAPEPAPAPPPQKPADDPHAKLIGEVRAAVDRYSAMFAEIKDEVSAEKATEEILRLTGRMNEIAGQLAKIPYKPQQNEQMLALQAQLSGLASNQVTSAEMRRVMGEPALAVVIAPANLAFMSGVAAVAQADSMRRLSELQVPAPARAEKTQTPQSAAPAAP